MFRPDALLHFASTSTTTSCLARPARFHSQARIAHSAFRLEGRDSAMPERFRIV